MTIQLYNSRTRTKEPFRPLDPANVRMYVCGPTVYDRAHIGNARPVVVFDVLYRLLRHEYGADHVTYACNFTDVDDRIIDKAVATKGPGETLEAATRRITDETIGWYHDDMGKLGALRPTHEPRCTEYIPQMVEMTQALVDKGVAYEAAGHVLFEVAKWPRYGELSGRSTNDMIAGARVEVAPYKRSPMDFVLWKPSTPEQPGWDSTWGRGRPGWHIECSAMAKALLGEEFDIHGGGIDLAFPHHENELAQSCCVHGTERMAQLWMHNGFLQVEGEKMSKSLGNFFTVRDLLNRGIPGEVIRFVLLSTHYRAPMDWTEKKVDEARPVLKRWGALTYQVEATDVSEEFLNVLTDDLNTAGAIAVLHKLGEARKVGALKASLSMIGLQPWESKPLTVRDLIEAGQDDFFERSPAFSAVREFFALRDEFWKELAYADPEFEIDWEIVAQAQKADIVNQIERRLKARQDRNFEKADAIRNELSCAGFLLKDSPNGTVWEPKQGFDPAKLEELL